MVDEWWFGQKEETCTHRSLSLMVTLRDPQELVPAGDGVGGRETHARWDRTGLGLYPVYHRVLGFKQEKDIAISGLGEEDQ